MGAGFCHNNVFRQYDGVDPYGYKDCGNYAFKFYCKNTSTRHWSPCYRDEDAVAMGLANRDAAGTKWYKDQGYDVQDNHKDCGDWYFQIHCIQHCSPCYRDEDALAVGIPNRDALGDKWCKDNGFCGKDGTDSSCGNWYYKFCCVY